MDRLEIAVRLLIEHPQNCEEWAFRRADKILAYHEETKPKREDPAPMTEQDYRRFFDN